MKGSGGFWGPVYPVTVLLGDDPNDTLRGAMERPAPGGPAIGGCMGTGRVRKFVPEAVRPATTFVSMPSLVVSINAIVCVKYRGLRIECGRNFKR